MNYTPPLNLTTMAEFWGRVYKDIVVPTSECPHKVLAFKWFPRFNGYQLDNDLKSFLNEDTTYVIHHTRNYTAARASTERRFGSSDSEVEKWDTWLDENVRQNVRTRAEDMWKSDSYDKFLNPIFEDVGLLPIHINMDKINKVVKRQKAKTKTTRSNTVAQLSRGQPS